MINYCLLHNIGEKKFNNPVIDSNYNSIEQIKNYKKTLTFDGIYENVYHNREILKDRKSIFFVMGNYIGGDNKFDLGMPYEKYCTWQQIEDLASNYDVEIGWHTWSHRDLTTLTTKEIFEECRSPFPTEVFAYPYGKFDIRCIDVLKELGYKKAFSVDIGDNSDYQILREYIR